MLFRYLFIFLVLLPVKAFALIEVDITRGNLNPLPVAVSPLAIDKDSKENFKKILKKENLGSEISMIVENNLKQSGLFNPLNKDAFLQKPDIANLKPRFPFFNIFLKLSFEFLSIAKGETATGRGFKFPLVISTSIKAKALIGNKINNMNKHLNNILSS